MHGTVKNRTTILVVIMLFLLTGAPVAFAQSQDCTSDDINFLESSLSFRGYLLMRSPEQGALFQETVENNLPDPEEFTDTLLCMEYNKAIRIADDILAGGNGKGTKLLSPWKQHTPEDLFKIGLEMDTFCSQEGADDCNGEKFAKFSAKSDELFNKLENEEISAPAFVDASYKNIKEALDLIKK